MSLFAVALEDFLATAVRQSTVAAEPSVHRIRCQ
jgi:hypothetical protein